MIYLDLEADGLNPTQIWCVVTMENGHPTVHTTPDTLSEALRSSVSVVGHNLIGYDIPVLERLWNVSVASERIVDTLVLSRLCDPSKSGGHSLRNWGNELGFPKGDHDDWTQLSQEMIDYCIQDVKVTEAVHQKLKRDLKDLVFPKNKNFSLVTFVFIGEFSSFQLGNNSSKARVSKTFPLKI